MPWGVGRNVKAGGYNNLDMGKTIRGVIVVDWPEMQREIRSGSAVGVNPG